MWMIRRHVSLRTMGPAACKEKEEAIKAEEAAKAAKDKKTTEEIKNKAPEQKSEPNIFEKIGTGIKNFFKNLFG